MYPALTTPILPSVPPLVPVPRRSKDLNNPTRLHPIIVSIIDLFSHVCLHRLHEGKRQKDGFKGSFLFSFEWFPRKVHYQNRHPSACSSNLSQLRVLITASSFSRARVHDYISSIHPGDKSQAAEGEFRVYPEFATQLLAVTELAPRLFNS